VLTAEEIAALDLSGLDWAVLSACETGVGDVLADDGVFGLQRAFQVAGARTVVTSLWAVDDAATRAWMDQFCRARLVLGRPTADAVRDASLALLRERRRTGQGSHPFYWAGFVVAGDWR
jgi:CHAT domain-containing protein